VVEVEVRLDGIIISGHPIPEAVPPPWLHGVLGIPDRVVDPAPPAPVGHRNNQVHVYDDLGLYFHEHHWTRLAMDLVFVFWPEEESYAFTPRRAFSGHLKLHDYLVPVAASESQFIRACPIPFEEYLSGHWRAGSERFAVGMVSKGDKLRSGRRGARRRIVSIDVSWPHDPWRNA
jgi:hypothetical protein